MGLPRSEGRQCGDHLVDDAAEGPQVGTRRDRLVGQQLRRHVLGGADEAVFAATRLILVVVVVAAVDAGGAVASPAAVYRRLEHLGRAEVGDHDVHVLVQQYVLRLEVAVDHVHVVQVLEGDQNLARVEFRAFDVERADLVDVRQQFAVFRVRQYEICESTWVKEKSVRALE